MWTFSSENSSLEVKISSCEWKNKQTKERRDKAKNGRIKLKGNTQFEYHIKYKRKIEIVNAARLLRKQNKIKEIYFFICYFSCIWINNQIERKRQPPYTSAKILHVRLGCRQSKRENCRHTIIRMLLQESRPKVFFPLQTQVKVIRTGPLVLHWKCIENIPNVLIRLRMQNITHTHTHATLARTIHRLRHARSCNKAMLFVNRFGWMSALCCQFILCAQFASV